MTTTGDDLPARPLAELAADINAAHEECAGAVRAGLAYAIRAGQLLLEAKARVGHGAWLPWVRRNCAFSERTAQAYMRVARGQLAATDPQRVARLSFRSALASLAAPRVPGDGAEAPALGAGAPDDPPAPQRRPFRARGAWHTTFRRAPRTTAPTTQGRAEEYGPNWRLIGGFLQRLGGLEFGALVAAVERWRAALSDEWHAADRAVAAAIGAAGRQPEREAVLEAEAEVFRLAGWYHTYRGAPAGEPQRPSKATSQYVAAAALVALLVRDRLAREHFETLYGPFAEAIPLAELDGGDSAGRAPLR